MAHSKRNCVCVQYKIYERIKFLFARIKFYVAFADGFVARGTRKRDDKYAGFDWRYEIREVGRFRFRSLKVNFSYTKKIS